jgi:predicted ribosomally synthesized peptide with SipW-like signal peptide
MKRILLSSSILSLVVASLVVGSTGAFFSDTEKSTANLLTAGAIDLKIDNTSYYNGALSETTTWDLRDLTLSEKFFDFGDLKPGDFGEDTVSVHVDTNDSYLCADVTLTSNDDNGLTEPESLVDSTAGVAEGELADQVNFVWWADDGDNVLEDDENVISSGPIGDLEIGVPYTVTLADSINNIWTGVPGPVNGEETVYIGKAWCFGNLSTEPLLQDGFPTDRSPANSTGGISCDGSILDNSTQTDSLTADISFTAIQSRHNSGFICREEVPIIGSCTLPDQEWADSVFAFDQSVRKNGTAVLPDRSDPSVALGVAESTGTPTDSVVPGSFVSLGFATSTLDASVTLSFDDNIIVNGAGPDVRIYEITGGSYPDEKVKVEASKDGVVWEVLALEALRDEDLDLGTLPWAKYIRLTDVSDRAIFEATADGYDLDALEALNCGVLNVN